MNVALENHDSCPHCGAPIFNLPTGPVKTCKCSPVPPSPGNFQQANNPKEALDIIEDLLQHCCSVEDEKGGTYLDSNAIRPFAKAIEFLSANGRVKIKGKAGRRILAEFI